MLLKDIQQDSLFNDFEVILEVTDKVFLKSLIEQCWVNKPNTIIANMSLSDISLINSDDILDSLWIELIETIFDIEFNQIYIRDNTINIHNIDLYFDKYSILDYNELPVKKVNYEYKQIYVYL